MKYLILAASMVFSSQAFAIAECAGRASDGAFVKITINTEGSMAIADRGEVSIEKGGNKFGYRFDKGDISQFFEYDDMQAESAVVGLTAYVEKENPISIKYVGPNFVDMDLKSVVDGGKAQEIKGNFVRVWKGPGRKSTDQYQLTKVACSVWNNI